MAYRILLVEDEETIVESLKLNLELEGYDLTIATDGEEAIQSFRKGRFDLVVLDVMLPKLDGFVVCQTIRLENTKVPILFLTAKNAAQDRIQGLKIGGDDYLTKPFNLEEFLLRVQNLIKRGVEAGGKKSEEFHTYQFGDNKVDFTTFEISTFRGEQKQISKREIMLLKLMIERKGEVVSREDILETVWGYDVYPSTRTIDNYILAFRKYFEEDPKNPVYFHSIRGVGYKFQNPAR
tara:strand:+ start:12936 stop:13643 length:708 start_codon:yes stop_codon:yes gene_type:complete